MGTRFTVQSVTTQSGAGRWSTGSGLAYAANASAEPIAAGFGHTHSSPCSQTCDGWFRRRAPQPPVGTYDGASLSESPNCQPW